MTSNRMSAAQSVLMARNFSKMFLRARRALEFSHSLDPNRKWSKSSLNHLVGAGEQLGRYGEVEHRRGLGIDDQLELARLHNWQVGGLGALEDAPSIGAGLAPRIRN